MTTGESGSTSDFAHDVPNVEQKVAHIREMTEHLIKSTTEAGAMAVDAYEKALLGMLQFEHEMGGMSQQDWVSALADAHARLVQDSVRAQIGSHREKHE